MRFNREYNNAFDGPDNESSSSKTRCKMFRLIKGKVELEDKIVPKEAIVAENNQ